MTWAADLIAPVGALIAEVAAAEILPRLRRLGADEVRQKSPGQTVTIADEAAERALAAGLAALLPNSAVVGEEAAADDPGLPERLLTPDCGPVWVIDPIDGTANFARGHADFAVMVALIRAGRTEAAWIADPLSGRIATAVLGGGAWLSAPGAAPERLRAAPPAPLARTQGVIPAKLFPAHWREEMIVRARRVGCVVNRFCAGHEYLDLAAGRIGFAVYWRTKVWDHAPGELIAREAGAFAARLDRAPYRPGDLGPGLILAADSQQWDEVRETLFEGLPPFDQEH